jgi:hypothetical protein
VSDLAQGNSITLDKYYSSFKSVLGALAGALSAIPILSALMPPALAGYGFPPLGNAEPLARVGTIGCVLFASYFAFFARADSPRAARKRVTRALIFAITFFVLYLAVFMRFVRTVDIPSKATSIHVSVGFDRTAFAKQNFSSETDEQMLRARGPAEEEVRRLWTERSLVIVRLALFGLYTLALSGFVCSFSWGIIADLGHHGEGDS